MPRVITALAQMQETSARRAPYKSLVRLSVAGTITYAIVDSGNLVVNAMSAAFAKRVLQTKHLEPYLTPLKCRIGTAQKGTSMQLLGVVTEPLLLRFGKGTRPYESRPLVFEGLNSEFNLAGTFLAQHGIDQLHSQGILRIQETSVPLVAPKMKPNASPLDHISTVSGQEKTPGPDGVYLLKGVEIPPRTGVWVHCRVPPASVDGVGIVMVNPGGELAPLLTSAIVQVEQQRCQLPVMNTGTTNLCLNEGTRYGTWEAPQADLQQSVQSLRADAATQTRSTKELTPDRKQWLLEALKLAEAPWLKDDKKLFNAAQDLILAYHDVFSRDDEYGTTDLVQHAIHTEDVPPIRCKGRPLNPLQQEDLKQQLKKWLDQKVIEPSSSPWSFGLLAVPKKNGKTRWCLDFRPLNAITKKDSFPLPNIEDNLARMVHSRCFSGLDGTAAYHVVSIRKQDREKTAFSTPFGLFQFRQMPFGLCNAPATYSRLVQLVLADLPPETCLPYLDDACLHTRDGWEHLEVLRQFFEAHRKAGLMLQPDKCQLFQKQVEYLGHLVSEEGIRPIPEYVRLVQEWPEPKSIKELRTFLGKIAYYRKFISQFSHTAAPLYNLLSKDAGVDPDTLQLNKEEQQSFRTLRKALTTAPILAYPDFHSPKPFILDTDWSHDPGAIGAVLSQEQGGEERVICYGARKLSKSERNYSSNKGELLAVIHFMRLWKYYLQPRPFILRTDHQALKWLETMEQPAGMTQRWLETLGNNHFTVQFRKGTMHGNADSLSRVTHAREATAQEEAEATTETMYFIQSMMHPETLSTAAVLAAQEEDEDLRQVRRWVQEQRRPVKEEIRGESTEVRQYAALFETLHIGEDQLLYRQPQVGEIFRQDRLCLPPALQSKAVQVAHEDAGGHMGMLVTQHRLLHRYYFPGLHKLVEEYIRGCQACQKKRPKPKDQKHTLVSTQEGNVWQKLSIDFVGPLQVSTRGNKYLLTVKDCFSRWVEAFPTADMTASTVAKVLQREIFSRFGLPEQIHSDQGTSFTAELIEELLRILGIQQTQTPAYNPKSNPVERSHQDLHRILRAMIDTVDADWEDLLPEVLLGLRTARNRATGVTPFYAVFGREAKLPIDYLYANPSASSGPRMQQNRDFIQRLRLTYQFMRKNIRATVERSRQLYSGKLQGDPLQPGDLVWVFTPAIKDRNIEGGSKVTKKHACFWTGPWKIQKKISNVLFVIETHGQWNKRELVLTVSIDRLSRFRQQDRDSTSRNLRLRDLQTSDEFLEQGTPDPDRRGPAGRGQEGRELEDDADDLGLEESAGSVPFLPAGGGGVSRRALSPAPSRPGTPGVTAPASSSPPPRAPTPPPPTSTPGAASMASPSPPTSPAASMAASPPTSPAASMAASSTSSSRASTPTPAPDPAASASVTPTEALPMDDGADRDEGSDPTYQPGGARPAKQEVMRYDHEREPPRSYALRHRPRLTRPMRYQEYETPAWWRKPITLPRIDPQRSRPARLALPAPPGRKAIPMEVSSPTLPSVLRPPRLPAPITGPRPLPRLPSPWTDRAMMVPSAPPLSDDDEDMTFPKMYPTLPVKELQTKELQEAIDDAARGSKVLKSTTGQDVTRHRTRDRERRREEGEVRRRKARDEDDARRRGLQDE